MKVRSALSAVLLGSLAVTAVGVSSGSASAGGSALAGRSAIAPRVDTVTVSGTFEQVVVDTVDGEHFRYLVRGADHTWWLEGLDGAGTDDRQSGHRHRHPASTRTR